MRLKLLKPVLFLGAYCLGMAQETIAPTPGSVGPGPGQDLGQYNVAQSWELGYRWNTVGGSRDAYRSMVNYGNGIRLLGSSLTVHSLDGHGRWFDEIVLNTQGLGNDPYQSATFRVQKNRLYDYNLLWRLNEYYNPNLAISGGDHFRNTQRRWQDHELTLFPQSRFRFRAGYGRTVEDGPAFTTEQVAEGNNAPPLLFADIRRELNSYSLGGDAEVLGIKLTVQRRWDAFKEDANPVLAASGPFGNTNASTVATFNGAQPYHGTTPTWLANVFTERSIVRVNGRATYSGGRTSSILDERFTGGLPGPANRLNQVIVFGNARRPALTGDLRVSIFPTKKLTIMESTSYSDIRIDGDETFLQVSGGNTQVARANFQFLGMRRFTSALDLRYAFLPKLSALRVISIRSGRFAPWRPLARFRVPSAERCSAIRIISTPRSGV
ncbi:MAG: hypothetical protein ABL995_18530 [Bryobacteraceae bacterium]